MHHILKLACRAALLCISTVIVTGCPQFEFGDFKRISYGGWGGLDNVRDKNNYAWAMKYFVPDGQETGHLYVGSGNNVLGLAISQIEAILTGRDEYTPPVFAPEIRRYRPDQESLEWEPVFDYADVPEQQTDRVFGFRHFQEYRTQTDGTKYLYAATMGNNAVVYRSTTGDPGTWERVFESGEEGSVRYMEPHNGILYVGLATDIPFYKAPGEIYATDGEDWWQVVDDGLGNPDNRGFQFLKSWNGWLYAGTSNPENGYEIWKFAGPNGSTERGHEADDAVQIVSAGGPSAMNEWAATPALFNGHLYVGSIIPIGFDVETGNGFKGCDIIRIAEDDSWETVVGDGGISGYGSGFNRRWNAYCWQMAEHDGVLFAGTFDQSSIVRFGWSEIPHTIDTLEELLLNGIRLLIEGGPRLTEFDFKQAEKSAGAPFNDLFDFGADLYKTTDGVNWEPVSLDGLGDPRNYGFRTMQSVGDTFYIGTANPFGGLQVWELDTAK